MLNLKQRWYRLQNANRKPEVELQNMINEQARLYAQSKRDRRIEEGQMWTTLFDNSRTLKRSLTRLPQEAVVSGGIRLDRKWFSPPPELLPSEHTRQFIIFKVRTSLRLFSENAPQRTRPKYADLYAQQREPRENNIRNVKELLKHCQTDAEKKARRKSIVDQTTLQFENQMKQKEQQQTSIGHRRSRQEQTLSEFPAIKKDSCLHMRRRQATVDSPWLPRISVNDIKRGNLSQKCVRFNGDHNGCTENQ